MTNTAQPMAPPRQTHQFLRRHPVAVQGVLAVLLRGGKGGVQGCHRQVGRQVRVHRLAYSTAAKLYVTSLYPGLRMVHAEGEF